MTLRRTYVLARLSLDTAYSHEHREQPQLSITRYGLEGHADVKVLRNAANRSIALTGMLPDGRAMKKGRNL